MQAKTEDGHFAAVMQNTCKWDAAAKSRILQKTQLYSLSSTHSTGLKWLRLWV